MPSAVGVLRENGVDCEITDNGLAFLQRQPGSKALPLRICRTGILTRSNKKEERTCGKSAPVKTDRLSLRAVCFFLPCGLAFRRGCGGGWIDRSTGFAAWDKTASEQLSAVEEDQNAHKDRGKEIGDPVKDGSEILHDIILL